MNKSNSFLKHLRLGARTMLDGSLFQMSMTRILKKNFLKFNLARGRKSSLLRFIFCVRPSSGRSFSFWCKCLNEEAAVRGDSLGMHCWIDNVIETLEKLEQLKMDGKMAPKAVTTSDMTTDLHPFPPTLNLVPCSRSIPPSPGPACCCTQTQISPDKHKRRSRVVNIHGTSPFSTMNSFRICLLLLGQDSRT